ncbi:hypothetical protein [Nitrosomonas communis]|uniref:hypothetical protein n=1 Tax=Nitrosomonas communis TaxID=44574 RepID=UPI003D2C00A7
MVLSISPSACLAGSQPAMTRFQLCQSDQYPLMLPDGQGIAFANTDTRALLNHSPPVFVLTRLFVRIEVLIKQKRLLLFDN